MCHQRTARIIEVGNFRAQPGLFNLGAQDILQLIFLPGFSTAEAVTNVSGRGVGMDVVKTNIESIGGTIEVESVPGEGTTCRLRIPLEARSGGIVTKRWKRFQDL